MRTPEFKLTVSRRHALALFGATTLFPLCKSVAAALPTGGESAGPLHYLSLEEMARRLASREISPVTITQ